MSQSLIIVCVQKVWPKKHWRCKILNAELNSALIVRFSQPLPFASAVNKSNLIWSLTAAVEPLRDFCALSKSFWDLRCRVPNLTAFHGRQLWTPPSHSWTGTVFFMYCRSLQHGFWSKTPIIRTSPRWKRTSYANASLHIVKRADGRLRTLNMRKLVVCRFHSNDCDVGPRLSP